MRQIKRALRMHRIFVSQELKRMMEYKGDFLVGIVGFLLGQFFNLLFIFSKDAFKYTTFTISL